MKVAIRVDASDRIGTGHFMRCLTLANALKQRGAQTRFISRLLPAHLQELLVEKGHQCVVLKAGIAEDIPHDLQHAHWLGVSQHTDARDCVEALSDQRWDWLIVDHYALDCRWESALRATSANILVIDDIADRNHDCDMLLDQNYYADMDFRYHGKVPAHCRLLLGPRYALLRDAFREQRLNVKPRSGPVGRILVFFGGIDEDNYTGHAIEALHALDVKGLQVDVVVGASHPQREQIESRSKQYRFDCYVQTERMAELMAMADLSIGAGGCAVWERCCLGLPALTICTADNQAKQVIDAAISGYVYAPEMRGDLTAAMTRHLSALIENSCLRQALSSRAMEAADGRGILRVLSSIGSDEIQIRIAGSDDAEKLFEWRNHPSIRAVSRHHEPIEWEDHHNWFTETLSSNDRALLIGYREEEPIGVVRFDVRQDGAEVSIYIVPGVTQAGLGSELLQAAEGWLSANQPEVDKISAHVLASNERSIRLFSGSGYRLESSCYSKVLHKRAVI